MTPHHLTELMTGLKLDYQLKAPTRNADRAILEVEKLTRAGQYHDVNFKLYAGEVLGLCGLLGSGRTELALSLFGMTKPDSGKICSTASRCVFAGTKTPSKPASATFRKIA